MSELLNSAADSLEIAGNYEYATAVRLANVRITKLEARLEITGPYDGIAARDETIRLLEARLVEQTGSHNDLVIRKSDRITELSVQLAHAEADSELIDLLEKAIGPGHAAAIVTIANWRHSHPSASFRDAIAAILRAKS